MNVLTVLALKNPAVSYQEPTSWSAPPESTVVIVPWPTDVSDPGLIIESTVNVMRVFAAISLDTRFPSSIRLVVASMEQVALPLNPPTTQLDFVMIAKSAGN